MRPLEKRGDDDTNGTSTVVNFRGRRLRAGPEGGEGAGEGEADAGFACGGGGDVGDAGFGFDVVGHIGKEQALAGGDGRGEGEGAAGDGEVEGFGFFVEGLVIGIGAVDEDEEGVRGAFVGTAVGFGDGGIRRCHGVKVCGRGTTNAMLLSLFECVPDAAHSAPQEGEESG